MFREWEIGRSVRLPFRWKNGHLQKLDGSAFPELREGAVGDVVVSLAMLLKESDRERLSETILVPLAAKGETLCLGLSLESVPLKFHKAVFRDQEPVIDPTVGLVPVLLESALSLLISPGHAGRLSGGACKVPALGISARSPNHALTLLSTEFELTRISHTGNVFTQGYLRRDGRWVRIAEIREDVMASTEIGDLS